MLKKLINGVKNTAWLEAHSQDTFHLRDNDDERRGSLESGCNRNRNEVHQKSCKTRERLVYLEHYQSCDYSSFQV